MTAALATLVFLAAAWAAILLLARTFEEKWTEMGAALTREPLGAAELPRAAIAARISPRYPVQQPMRARARPLLRAAA